MFLLEVFVYVFIGIPIVALMSLAVIIPLFLDSEGGA